MLYPAPASLRDPQELTAVDPWTEEETEAIPKPLGCLEPAGDLLGPQALAQLSPPQGGRRASQGCRPVRAPPGLDLDTAGDSWGQ